MKKTNLIMLVAIIVFSVTFFNSQAQVAMNRSRTSLDDGSVILSKVHAGESVALNRKAERNFKRDYQLASGAEWSVLGDKLLMCRFFMNSVLFRAYYTPHGNWIYTTSGYDGGKLDQGVADRIKSVYYDSRIVYVNQIDLVGGRTFYIVEIHNEKSIRKVRVNDDDMEIVQEFAKQ